MATSLASVKIVLLGNASVGKSSILQRFASDMFTEHSPPTVGAAFTTKVITVKGRQIKFDIWDTAGQEKYRSMTPLYYRGAYAAIIVYDLTDKQSFDGAVSWINEIRNIEGKDIEIAVVGNKVDLQSNQRQIATETAKQYAADHGFLFTETSAKSGVGVSELFHDIGATIPSNLNAHCNRSDLSASTMDFIRDDHHFETKTNRKQCC